MSADRPGQEAPRKTKCPPERSRSKEVFQPATYKNHIIYTYIHTYLLSFKRSSETPLQMDWPSDRPLIKSQLHLCPFCAAMRFLKRRSSQDCRIRRRQKLATFTLTGCSTGHTNPELNFSHPHGLSELPPTDLSLAGSTYRLILLHCYPHSHRTVNPSEGHVESAWVSKTAHWKMNWRFRAEGPLYVCLYASATVQTSPACAYGVLSRRNSWEKTSQYHPTVHLGASLWFGPVCLEVRAASLPC